MKLFVKILFFVFVAIVVFAISCKTFNSRGLGSIGSVGSGSGGGVSNPPVYPVDTNATVYQIDSVVSAKYAEAELSAPKGVKPHESSHSKFESSKDAVSSSSIRINNTSGANVGSYPTAVKVIEKPNTKVVSDSADLSKGRIVYKIPDTMNVRTAYKVFLRIAKSKATISIYEGIEGTVIASVIPVTETMEVRLIDLSPDDNKAFEIVGGNDAVQIIESGDTYTEWSWSVTPVRTGNSKLKIVVSIIRNDKRKDIVYEDAVEVQRDVINQTSFFFKKYWQWLLSTLIIPFGVWLYKRTKKA